MRDPRCLGEAVQLTCNFLAHPDWSVRVIWMADYSPPLPMTTSLQTSVGGASQAQQIQQIPSSASNVLLYDSHFDAHERTATTTTTTAKVDSKQAKRPPARIRLEQSNRNWTSAAPAAAAATTATATSRGHKQRSQTPADGYVSLAARLSIDSVRASDAAR